MPWDYTTKAPRNHARTLRIALGCAALGLGVQQVLAEDYFNPAMLDIDAPDQGKPDLSLYESGPGIAPGEYQVDVYVNNNKIANKKITFELQKSAKGESILQPCLSVENLKSLGIQSDKFSVTKGDDCVDLSGLPDASATFRPGQQQLLLSIPQAAIIPVPHGYVPPEEMDNGINAFLLNYSYSAGDTHSRGDDGSHQRNEYLNLRPGVNLGAWRFRNYTTWSQTRDDDSTQHDFSSVYSYAQRNILSLGSVVTFGQSSTPSDVFDSLSFTGAQIASDDDMLPDSMKGFAPRIRGVAHSNAQVVVRQNGYVIYQNYVAPGAFEINDLYPTGGSGDLNVTVKETDGSEQHFVVPYASVPVLQREGRFKYSLTGGRYRSYDDSVEKTPFLQGTGIYGLPYDITLYGGMQTSQYYDALALGTGKNIGDLGAFSVDVTAAKSRMQGEKSTQGRAWRVRYSKDFATTGTHFSLAGYRYNSDGYATMSDVMNSYTKDDDWTPPDGRRDRQEATVDQSLGGSLGSLTLSLVKENYWHSDQSMTSLSVGYNGSWNGISYGLNYGLSKNTQDNEDDDEQKNEQTIGLNVSVPLDHWLKNTWVNYTLNNSKHDTTQSVGLSGTALAGNNLSWGVQQGHSHDSGYSSNLNTDYKATYGEMTAGYSQDNQQHQLNVGVQGSVIAHAHGVTFGQPMGDTVALVEAPGASGTGIDNQTGVKTDYRGYAIVPYVTPYHHNTVTLDTESLPSGADVGQATKVITPTRGAVVRASFDTRVGSRVLLTLTRSDGHPVPFGATAAPAHENGEFIVGDGGQVYLTGMHERGTVNVSWGRGASAHCSAHYQLPSHSSDPVINATAQCV
ncbi:MULTISPECIES: fimbria/pilus outer membrane usher protein [unclassified Leclercia]|uniref:Fimbrial biogenesis outer membrane usher protein n=1 Tax=Leclercia barmai TaxID=2785629 RepID=A0ABS7RWX8_9ENTR|nr:MULTISPECIES: fimbria/pilus outer membrane usher protein [unclassified Leclercia]MBZ0058812.1 fimbrial biogenesis outer membrane usher protein [Leclercia sp. EMC7]MCM5696855.1 fimbrial biogenesis outer membrane usher protein [Leclercia sp. LTM01]MCM5701313.1 fimbrial biogenesis outer membrane usher protein [Leclercia sp. LTM14]